MKLPHQELKQIVIIPKTSNAFYDVRHDLVPDSWNYSRENFPTSTAVTISGLNLNHWDVKFEYEYTDEFKKVASVVGKDKAAEVIKALKASVPDDWDAYSG